MADFGKIKKNRFGSGITHSDSSTTLEAPEHAPNKEEKKGSSKKIKKARNKTNRTIPFSTRVSEEFDIDFRQVAFTMKLKKVDLLEECLKIYKKNNGL